MCWWHVSVGRVIPIRYLGYTADREGAHDRGFNGAADSPGEPYVRKHARKQVEREHRPWRETRRESPN